MDTMNGHGFYGFAWPMFWALFGLSFWLVGEATRHHLRVRTLKAIERMSEKGTPIPPEMLELLKPSAKAPRKPGDDLKTALILLAVALGLIVLGVVDNYGEPPGEMSAIYGVAAIPGFIGLVYLGLWRFNRGRIET